MHPSLRQKRDDLLHHIVDQTRGPVMKSMPPGMESLIGAIMRLDPAVLLRLLDRNAPQDIRQATISVILEILRHPESTEHLAIRRFLESKPTSTYMPLLLNALNDPMVPEMKSKAAMKMVQSVYQEGCNTYACLLQNTWKARVMLTTIGLLEDDLLA